MTKSTILLLCLLLTSCIHWTRGKRKTPSRAEEDRAARMQEDIDISGVSDVLLPRSYGAKFTSSMRAATAQKIKSMFVHGWTAYRDNALPADELKPLSCAPRLLRNRGNMDDVLGNYSLTLVDSLDALVVFGMFDEFAAAVGQTVRFVDFEKDVFVSVFEVTIRMLGGLLSAHVQADSVDGVAPIDGYNGELLAMAVDLADRLMPAFQSDTGMPYPRVNLVRGVRRGESTKNCLAGAGTLLIEFGMLSRLSGDERYYDAALAATRRLWRTRSPLDLVPDMVNVHSGASMSTRSTIGAGSDSFYEYLLKAWMLFGDMDDDGEMLDATTRILRAVETLMEHEGWYLPVHTTRGSHAHANPQMVDALQAFWPALQVLDGRIDDAVYGYRRLWQLVHHFGLPPELYTPHSNRHHNSGFPLRPEFIESTYLLYRATRDDFFLHVGAAFVEQLEARCRIECGYAAVRDVAVAPADHRENLEDTMDSFFLTETLKYLYLLFVDDDHFLHRDNYVFSTEAHYFPVRARHRSRADGDTGLHHRPCMPSPFSPVATAANDGAASDVTQYFMQCHRRLHPKQQARVASDTAAAASQKQQHQQQATKQARISGFRVVGSDASDSAPTNTPDRAVAEASVELQRAIDEAKQRLASNPFVYNAAVVIELVCESEHFLHPNASVQAAREEELTRMLNARIVSNAGDAQRRRIYWCAVSSGDGVVRSEQLEGIAVRLYADVDERPDDFVQFEGSGALFGPSFAAAGISHGAGRFVPIVAQPADGCAPLATPVDAGVIPVMLRGNCTFVDKVRHAQQAGAHAAIILNNIDEPVTFRMSGDPIEERNPTIPSMLLPFAALGPFAALAKKPSAKSRIAFYPFDVPARQDAQLYFRITAVGASSFSTGDWTNKLSALVTAEVQRWIDVNIHEQYIAALQKAFALPPSAEQGVPTRSREQITCRDGVCQSNDD
jgi:Glycosyl hydrolase family 47/PA domain